MFYVEWLSRHNFFTFVLILLWISIAVGRLFRCYDAHLLLC